MGVEAYDVKIAPAAARQLKKLERSAQVKVVQCLEALVTDPRPSGVEKLSQDPRFWRVRVGDYRIIYWIDDTNHILVAMIVRHRREAYRDLDKLDPAVVAKTLAPILTNLGLSNTG